MEDRIFEILIPTEESIEDRNGKKKIVTRKLLPSYIVVKMIYGDDLWHNITRTRGITGFVGPNGRALALTEDEVRRMKLEVVTVNIDLHVGDKVEVIDGPFAGQVGSVISVDVEDRRCRINVEMFGRDIPVDLEFNQIRKI
jgi:transcriptional antiterminator NusG